MALHDVPLQDFLSEGCVSVGPNARQSIVMRFFHVTPVPYHCFFSDFIVHLFYVYSLSFLPNLVYYLRLLAIIHHTFCADVFVIKKFVILLYGTVLPWVNKIQSVQSSVSQDVVVVILFPTEYKQ